MPELELFSACVIKTVVCLFPFTRCKSFVYHSPNKACKKFERMKDEYGLLET